MSDPNWNPMQGAHNDPNFNSYNSGPGRNFQASGGVNNTKLYITNVPADMTEIGLSNIFTSAVGVPPTSASVVDPKGNYTTKIGFVAFSNAGEASKAIMALNKKPTLYLGVSYQKPKPERNAPPNNQDTLACNSETSTSPRDQALPPSPRAGYFDPRGGASGTMDLPSPRQAGGGAQSFNVSVSADSGGRTVSLGRGYIAPPPSGGGAPRRSLLGEVPSEAAGRSLLGESPSALASPPRIPAVHVPNAIVQVNSALIPCNNCKQPAGFVCKLCAVTRYCSRACADDHWKAHKHTCVLLSKCPGIIPVAVADEPNTPPPSSEVSVAEAKPFNSARPPTQAGVAAMDDYVDLPTTEFTMVTVTVVEGGTAWVMLDSCSDDTLAVSAEITARKNDLARVVEPRVGDRVAALFGTDWFRGRVVKAAPLQVLYVDYGNTEHLEVENIRVLPAEFTCLPAQAVCIAVMPSAAGTRRTLSINQRVNVRAVRRAAHVSHVALEGEDAPPPAQEVQRVTPAAALVPAAAPKLPATPVKLPAAPAKLPAKLPAAPTEELPAEQLPAGVPTAVTVVGAAGDGAAWVNTDANADALTELFARLRVAFANAPPAADLAVGKHVAVTHLRAVHRARVTAVGGSGVSLRLVDDGKDVVVDAAKIRTLPAEFLALKAQGIQIRTKEGVPSDFPEGAEIRVEPIAKAPSGATIVAVLPATQPQLPCQQRVKSLSKDEATAVYFVSKENGEKYIQTKSSVAVLQEMLAELKLLGPTLQPCAAVEGAVVLVEFEGEWSRAKIVSARANIEVVFIDYGNKATYAKEDIRELPEKFTKLPGQCMKVFITEDSSSAVKDLEEFNVFQATLVGETTDGSLVIRGKL